MNAKLEQAMPPVQLIESMRDFGYSMDTALADIVDNSITAGARQIDVRFLWNDGEPWLIVRDDGKGMSSAKLKQAMFLGSMDPRLEREKNDLGRFGLGMKTASFSQCRKLTVYSKETSGEISGRQWDLDFIEANPDDGWVVKVFEEVQSDHAGFQISMDSGQGTAVIWENMDRFDSEGGEREFNRQLSQAKSHLGLVFHRFIKSGVGKDITITFNGDAVTAFDPFNSANTATNELCEERRLIGGQEIVITPFVLPHHTRTTDEEYVKYEGERGYLRNQGFYIYRNERLIISGTWFRLIKQGELTKLVRVRVDIPNTLDHIWNINIMKSSAHPPPVIREVLRQVIPKIKESGTRVYRARGKKIKNLGNATAWVRREAGGKISYEIDRNHPVYKEISEKLSDSNSPLLSSYVALIENSFPIDAFFSDAASSPKDLQQPEMSDEQTRGLVVIFARSLFESGSAVDEVREKLSSMAQFHEKSELINEVMIEMQVSE